MQRKKEDSTKMQEKILNQILPNQSADYSPANLVKNDRTGDACTPEPRIQFCISRTVGTEKQINESQTDLRLPIHTEDSQSQAGKSAKIPINREPLVETVPKGKIFKLDPEFEMIEERITPEKRAEDYPVEQSGMMPHELMQIQQTNQAQTGVFEIKFLGQ